MFKNEYTIAVTEKRTCALHSRFYDLIKLDNIECRPCLFYLTPPTCAIFSCGHVSIT